MFLTAKLITKPKICKFVNRKVIQLAYILRMHVRNLNTDYKGRVDDYEKDWEWENAASLPLFILLARNRKFS